MQQTRATHREATNTNTTQTLRVQRFRNRNISRARPARRRSDAEQTPFRDQAQHAYNETNQSQQDRYSQDNRHK